MGNKANVELASSVRGIPIVCEFSNIFWIIYRGYIKKEVEFSIKLAPTIAPIFKASYSMALVELQKLKKQLQKLFDCQFI